MGWCVVLFTSDERITVVNVIQVFDSINMPTLSSQMKRSAVPLSSDIDIYFQLFCEILDYLKSSKQDY